MRLAQLTVFFLAMLVGSPVEIMAADSDRAARTVVLDEIGVRNLRIQTVPVEPRTFESTVFAIGRLEETPSSRAVLSSRISGRALRVHAFVGDHVEAGMTLVEVESRQPGNPPPIISLKAPMEGLIIDSHVRPGQPVEPQEELLDISDRSTLWAVAKIPEQEAATIKVGTPARIRIPATGDAPIEATLSRFGIAADRAAGAVDGIFEIANPTGSLQPGMRAEFSLIVSKRENVMAVPRESLQGDPSKRMVFVRDFDLPNAFVRAPVEIGEQNDGFVEIVRGLFPGDDVVTQGAYSLGFAGSGSLSLKEALDAAHGHEHNEDGSEITPKQRAAESNGEHGSEDESLPTFLRAPYLAGYALIVTLALLFVTQLCLNQRRKLRILNT